MADPVINAVMAGSGMKSTMKPRRRNPRKATIAPQIIAKAEAIVGPGISG
jgi:hypothetical protein